MKRFLKALGIIVMTYLLFGVVADLLANWRFNRLPIDERLSIRRKERSKYYSGIEKALKGEKIIYLTARTLIAVFLLIFNYLYWKKYNMDFDLSKQAGVNNIIILCYSFLAFVMAGTPKKFVELMRQTILNMNRRLLVGKIDIEKVEQDIKNLEEKLQTQTAR